MNKEEGMEEEEWRRVRRRCDMKMWRRRRDGRTKGKGRKEGEEEKVTGEKKKKS